MGLWPFGKVATAFHWSDDSYAGVPAPCGATENLTMDGSKVTCPICRRHGLESRNAAGEFAGLDYLNRESDDPDESDDG